MHEHRSDKSDSRPGIFSWTAEQRFQSATALLEAGISRFCLWVACSCAVAFPALAGTLVSTQSAWRFAKGTAEVSSPTDVWRTPAFDDSNWASGPAPFYYGENVNGGTLLSDMHNGYSSIFLRQTFDLADSGQIQDLRLRALCDDGFVAWINGVEVARYNMPAGSPAFNSLASVSVPEPVNFAVYTLPKPSYLAAGRNVLAVQVFNNTLSSSDLQWDAELLSTEIDVMPPRIASVEPPPGTLEGAVTFTLTFTEPVAGVRAADLFLGAQAAAVVQGAGARYTFSFDPPAAGPIELRWDADTLITDLASPPNRFDPKSAGPWQYEIVDRTPPFVADITPRPGLTMSSLTQVELRFSEPVAGIDAADLLVNGVAASSVSGDAVGPYRFQFTPPASGTVRFSWAPNHGIHDLAKPANAFVGAEWSVELNPNFVMPTVRINEFLAANVAANGLKDEDGELQDWIEILNSGNVAVNLEGWSLTDDKNDPGRWLFPSVALGAGQYLVVFASAKDRRPTTPGAKLHTNFKLNPAGEYWALLNPESPRAVASEFAPAFPEQRNDYSFGFDASGQSRYFRTPTPGAANGVSAVDGVVPPSHVNVGRGWFDRPFTLLVTSALPGVTHRYTTDGSEPTESNGQVYSEPLQIARTTTLRVAGFKSNLLPSSVVTHTYLFADDILRQPNNPPGFPVGPTVMAGFPSDYEMDPEIVTHPLYSGILNDALLALPTLSIVCRRDDMFGTANGIYTHPTSRGPTWERPCSVEFIPTDGAKGFQVNAGVQIQGNAAREPQKQPKHPMRLVFKGDYGPAWLDYPMFPDSPLTRFDTLVLRADFNFSWLHWDPTQRRRAQRTRDAWTKDSMRTMGGLASHNRYVHLFINGLYWGIYDPSERPDASFGAGYLGGQKEDYDVMNEGAAVDGDNRAYNAMLAISNLAAPAAYAQMQRYLDITQYIDYMLLHFYVGHEDWGQNKNWYAIRPKDGRRGFAYVPWDGENLLSNPTYNRVSNADTPSGLHTKLVANAEYRLAFADRVQKHFFNGGALTPEAVTNRWLNRARQVELAIVAESARWGDYRRDVHQFQSGPYELYTRDNQWRAEQNRLLTQYFPQRTATVLNQLRAAGLYPDVAAPSLSQFGGRVERGFGVSLSAPAGTIYYTTDGTDPRIAGTGNVAGTAVAYTAPIAVTGSVRVKARAFRQGTWSALTEADFQVAEFTPPLRFTEIMYHPPDGDAFEFVELQNTGSAVLDATGFSFSGIEFVFPPGLTVAPGQFIVLASSLSPSAFAARFPGLTVNGYFNGSLGNGGERIELRDRNGRIITAVAYGDHSAWPARADGGGYSLEVVDPNGDPNDPANWLATGAVNGSPGRRPTPPTIGPVRLNEILAHSSDDLTNESAADWIELANTGGSAAPLEGWTLTDHGGQPFVFPAGASVLPNGFAVVSCDGQTNAPGFHAPFKLSRQGETIGLYDAAGERVDAVTFGLQAPGFSVGHIENANGWTLTRPTPNAANTAAETAPATRLKVNEWLANAQPGEEDWLELFNADDTRPAASRGLVLSTDKTFFQIQELSFVPPRGFVRFFADERSGTGHVDFKLPSSGGFIALLDAAGREIDRVIYLEQREGVSKGRSPDGAPAIISFPGSGTPGQSNAPSNPPSLVLNEILVTTPNISGWVELFNSGTEVIDLARFEISLEADGSKAWTFPAGSQIAPSGFFVVGFDEARAASGSLEPQLQSGRSLAKSGESVYLRDANGGFVDAIQFGSQIAGRSIGRSGGTWRLLSTSTPGAANASPSPLGSASALRINEWLAAPATGDDWIELFNPEPNPVALSGLSLTDDLSLAGKNKSRFSPLSFIAAKGWAAFRADGTPEKGPEHLNFSLDALGESLRLCASDGTVIDAVDFGLQQSGISEGRLADGGTEIGPLTGGPTLGSSNTPAPGDRDTDGDGLPDSWEIASGTNPSAPDADADPDADGLTNFQEFLAGTNPVDSASALQVLRVSVGPGSVVLEFVAVSNRTYSVQFKRTLADATWIKLTDISAQPTNRVQSVSDPAPKETRFYRLVTPAGL